YPRPRSGRDEEADRRGVCTSRVRWFGKAIRSKGQSPYNEAQQEGCECCRLRTEHLVVDEKNATLKLRGSFGTQAGTVTAGGRPLTNCVWAADSIVCSLPATGPGSNGDV